MSKLPHNKVSLFACSHKQIKIDQVELADTFSPEGVLVCIARTANSAAIREIPSVFIVITHAAKPPQKSPCIGGAFRFTRISDNRTKAALRASSSASQ